MSLIMSMAAFALAASITPGPVNIVALSSGARFGFRASQRHVAGATLGFVLLLVLMGLGLHELLQWWPAMTQVVQWAGVAFLLYMAFKLAADNGQLEARDSRPRAVDALWRRHAMAQPEGLAGLCGRHGRVRRRWRGPPGVAVRCGVPGDLLPVGRMLGLRRDVLCVAT